MKLVIVAAAGLAAPQALIDAQRQEYLQSLRDLNDLLAANGRRPGRRAPARRSGPAPEGRSRVARADRARPGRRGGGDMSVVLEARNLAKTYDTGGSKVLALRGVDLAVRAGRVRRDQRARAGAASRRCSTCSPGSTAPRPGEVWLDGERIDELGETRLAHLRRRKIGFVFQFFNLIPTLSAVENVELPLLLVGRPRREARGSAGDLLSGLGVLDKQAAAPSQLSGGAAAAGRAGPRAGQRAGHRARRRADREPRLGGGAGRARPAARGARPRADAAAGDPRRERRLGGRPRDHAARRPGRRREPPRAGRPHAPLLEHDVRA